MPITLVTGLPGHGKTLYTLVTVKKLAEESNRPVYYHGINDLQLSWKQLDDPKQWNTLPEGSIIVIDECQDLFPVHETKLASEEYVLQLAKHRHRGYDIFLISQHPMNIHAFVRRLIDKHFHTIRAFGMQASNFHEWNRVVDYPEKQKKDGQTKIFNYPKDAYTYYKSAEVHTIQRKIPNKVKMLLLIPPLLVFCAWYAWKILNPQHQSDLIKGKSVTDSTVTALAPATVQPDVKNLSYMQAHAPEIQDFPHTAIAYKEITKPVHAPYPAACVSSVSQGCKCYSQQGTLLPTSESVCLQIVKTGFFIEWEENQQKQQTAYKGDGVKPHVDSNRSSSNDEPSRHIALNLNES